MQDLRYAFKLLTRDRGFTVVAALALALGIASTTSLITVVNAVILRGLPLADSDRLVAIAMRDPLNRQLGMSYPDFDDWQRELRSFSGMTSMLQVAFSVSDENHLPEQFFGPFTSTNLFTVIGQRPLLGRDFTADDDRAGAPPVVILGYGMWQARYGGDPGIIGRTIRINGLHPTVVGVMGPDMKFPPNSDLWMPLSQTNTPRVEGRGIRSFSVIARLAEGVTLEQARAEITNLARETARKFPQSNQDLVPEIVTYQEQANGPQNAVMYWSLLGAAVFVLLIACANVANLLLARSFHRSREVSIRVALGASRWRIVRQLIVESVSLAAIGGVLSVPLVMLGVWMFDQMTRDAGRPYYVTYAIEPSVFAIIAASCLAVGIGFGFAPAWHSAKADVNVSMKEGSASSGSRRQQQWVATMTVSQVALAVVLLSGTGLLIRSVINQYELSLGFQTSQVIAMQLPLPGTKYPTSVARLDFMRRVDERLAEVTAIEASSTASNTPLGGGAAVQFSIDGRQTGTAERAPLVTMLATGSRYFDVLRSPLLRGRSFTDIDGQPGRDVAIVNQRFAEMYFAGVDPIGHSVQLTQNPSLRTVSGTPASALTIVGVSQTIRQRNMREVEADPVVYVPRPAVTQSNRATLLVRSARDPAETTAVLREEIRALDPDMPVFNVRTLEADLATQRWPLIVIGSTFGLFAGIGLVLSAVGLFGLTSYSVAKRMKEIALRIALGALPANVVWLLFGRVAGQVMLGLMLGVAGAYAMGQVLQGMLVQTSATDPMVLAAVGVVLLVVASVTCLVPARRATRIQPVAVLRAGQP
ncbi:MAG TPA: ABC transporter permease [Vicinamibacterales bacterium]|nr:ABC transporter permease [Vicinamibacterales bacterium]